jgi:NADPH-dependent 2,4-dienoyl-CoA reductase/sulfur reductase-like enzyme
MQRAFVAILFVLLTLCQGEAPCQVVIAGGTTAAFAAAISSAAEGVQTCLLEPTDWVGGQLTASGVPAVDFEVCFFLH